MRRYTPDELAEVLRLHKLWLDNEEGGQGADLQGADLQGADLQGADLQGADLRRADLQGADLQDANLQDAYLQGANLQDANLQDADLQYADLQGANLQGAYLQRADLQRANLRRANLQGANLQGADLQGANGENMKVAAMSVFTGLYPYQCWAVAAKDGTAWVRMGCLWKSVEEWDRIGIRASNPGEFPDDGSEKCEERVRAFEFVRAEAVRMAEKIKLAQAS